MLNKNNMEFPGVIKKKCGISRGLGFNLGLKISVTQFCGVSKGEALFSLVFL